VDKELAMVTPCASTAFGQHYSFCDDCSRSYCFCERSYTQAAAICEVNILESIKLIDNSALLYGAALLCVVYCLEHFYRLMQVVSVVLCYFVISSILFPAQKRKLKLF
jgi:hypothetical protein